MSQADWFDHLSHSIREHETERRQTFASLGRYRLMEELGRGGMGVVYHAFDPQLGREVALKVLLDQGFATPEARERFVREAQVAARLSHPNIIPVFDTGEHEGRVYLAMQFVEGTPLDRARLGPREAVDAVRDAARAVHAAHEEGIIHRDIKPANLMVDRGGRVYVTDFGLARRVESGASLTLAGTVVGTPAYMPPEQAFGRATDARSDVYALGATLYEVLTGKPPFSGATPLETLKAVTLDEPLPPRRHDPRISNGLEAVILKAMDKKPEGRYATAAEFADDLDRWLRGEEVKAPVRGTLYRIRKKALRHRWRVISAVSVGALLLVTALAIALRPDPRIERIYRLIAERQLTEAQALIDDLPEGLRAEPQIALDRAAKPINEPPLLQPPLPRFETLLREFYQHLKEGKTGDAMKVLQILESEGYPGTQSLLPELRKRELADGLERLEELAKSRSTREFEALFRKLRGPEYAEMGDDTKLAQSALRLGLELARGSPSEDAIRWLDEAHSLGSRHVELFEQRGLVLIAREEWEAAERDYEDYNKRRLANQPRDPRFSKLFRWKASSSPGMKESLRLLETALEINPRDAQALQDHGWIRYRSDGLARESLDELMAALKLDPTLKPLHEYAEIALAAAHQRSEAWRHDDPAARQAAWKDAVEALDLGLERVAPGDPALLLERARFLRRRGDVAGALRDSTNAGDSADAFLVRGRAHYPADLASAAVAFEQAGALNPRSALAPYWKGVCLQALGRPAHAKDEFLAAISLGFDGPDLHARLASIALEQQAWLEIPGRTARVHESADAVSEDELLARQAESRTAEIRRLRRDAHYLLARSRFENKDYDKAVDECNLALSQDPTYYEAHFRKGYALYHLRRHDEAIKAFDRAIERKRGDAAPLIGRATARAEKGLLDEALRDYDAAIQIEPDNYAALAGRGLAREAKGQIPDARDDLKKAIEKAPAGWPHRDRILKKLAELK